MTSEAECLPVLLVVSVSFTVHVMPKVENATSNNEAQGGGRRDLTDTGSFLLSQTSYLPHLRRIPDLHCAPETLGEEEQGRACYQVCAGRSLERGLEGQTPRLLRGLSRRWRRREKE